MKWNSIRTKFLAALAVSLAVSVGGTLLLLRYSFARNSQILAVESVTGAQKLFQVLETREIGKMTAVSETLMINSQVRDALAAKDRRRLMEATAPLYAKLKEQGITNWMFHTPEPDMSVFLRLHNPAKFGDHLGRYMDQEVVQTHTLVTGNELAKAGFAVRILRPFYDSQGKLSGYVEFGEEIGRFIEAMKSQTGDDYALLLDKKFVDRQFWADSSALWKRRDNWDDHPNFVVADKTTANDSIIQFHGELAGVDAQGKVLERFEQGNSVFVRGMFPIRDASSQIVGAMFVVRDISSVYVAMRTTQTILVILSVTAQLLLACLVLAMLRQLVFERLKHIIVVATRVVGGDFTSAIECGPNDEIGQFERLFEQFRCVFVELMNHVPEFQEKR